MRQLRFVGPGEDRDHLVVATADGADQFSLLVDEDLRSAVQSDLPRLFGPESDAHPTISPREIQVRVRAGASAESVATDADVPLERVLVFAGPVLAERTMITGEARRARARRSTPEGQLVEFGTAVDARFAAHEVAPTAVRWDSRRREDGQWVVSATWRDGEVERGAEWAFSLSTRIVTPMDETAADLLSDRPIRPVARAVPDPPEPTPPASPGPPPARPAHRPMRVRPPDPARDRERVVVQDDDQGGVPDPEAHTAPLPVAIDDGLFDADTADDPADEAAPPLPLRLADPPPAPPAPRVEHPPAGHVRPNGHGEEHKESRGGKPRIPSWDDIMLGVRRKKD